MHPQPLLSGFYDMHCRTLRERFCWASAEAPCVKPLYAQQLLALLVIHGEFRECRQEETLPLGIRPLEPEPTWNGRIDVTHAGPGDVGSEFSHQAALLLLGTATNISR